MNTATTQTKPVAGAAQAKRAVENAIRLYAETSGQPVGDVCERFAQNEECRHNIYLLVAMQASSLPYGRAVLFNGVAA